MKHYIFDALTRRCIGYIEGAVDGYNGDGVLVNADSMPVDLVVDETASLYLAEDGISVTYDTTALLELSKTARKARIKAEAKALIEALDWRVTRARERAEAGISGGESLASVLGLRESIRTSSSAAEAAVEALTDVASVQSFSWSVV